MREENDWSSSLFSPGPSRLKQIASSPTSVQLAWGWPCEANRERCGRRHTDRAGPRPHARSPRECMPAPFTRSSHSLRARRKRKVTLELRREVRRRAERREARPRRPELLRGLPADGLRDAEARDVAWRRVHPPAGAVRDRVRPHRDRRRRPRLDARGARRGRHRARASSVHRPRGRVAALLRPRPG
jgi:hypothetical protein